MQRFEQLFIVFLIGFIIYPILEILWRGHTHWTMAVAGGLCVLTLFLIYTKFDQTPIWVKCLIGAVVITSIEFIFGCIFNLVLKWNVWDYSSRPGNILGQVCIQYAAVWAVLSLPIIFLSDFLKDLFSKM